MTSRLGRSWLFTVVQGRSRSFMIVHDRSQSFTVAHGKREKMLRTTSRSRSFTVDHGKETYPAVASGRKHVTKCGQCLVRWIHARHAFSRNLAHSVKIWLNYHVRLEMRTIYFCRQYPLQQTNIHISSRASYRKLPPGRSLYRERP